MRLLRLIVQSLVAVLCFALGGLFALFVLTHLFNPGPDCPSPCDGPAYAALGVTLFVGPVVGVFFAAGGVWLVSKLFRGKRASAG